jgi:thiamine pyrophosphokinase
MKGISMHVVVFAGGTLRPGKAVDEAIATANLIIAADSGAILALHYGCTPAFVVGDFDSLTTPLSIWQALGSTIIPVAAEKDETDTELALDVAIQQGADRITLLGGLGGARFEHTIANVLLLASFETPPIRIVDGPSICWLLRGPASTQITGQPGDLLSLFPFTADATGIYTKHLSYPLKDGTLHFGKARGISNILIGEEAEVSLEQGMLLVIYTNKQELVE